jgi:cytidylate kinase
MAIITVSRGTFSGGKELAESVAKKLGYKCVSREKIIQSAAEFGIPEKTLNDVLTKAPTFWNRFLKPKKQYLTLLRSALLTEAVKGNIVYHGHAGHLLLRGDCCILKVKLIANMGYRIEQAMKMNNFTKDEAIQYIHDIDESRIKWTKFLYGLDWNDPALYDIVLNLSAMDIDMATNTIASLAKEDAFRPNEITDKIIQRLYLSSKVEVAMLMDKRTSHLHLTVEALDDGVVEVKGAIEQKKLKKDVLEIAKAVEGVKKIHDKMTNSIGIDAG